MERKIQNENICLQPDLNHQLFFPVECLNSDLDHLATLTEMFKCAENFYSIIFYDLNERSCDKTCIKIICGKGVLELTVGHNMRFFIPM